MAGEKGSSIAAHSVAESGGGIGHELLVAELVIAPSRQRPTRAPAAPDPQPPVQRRLFDPVGPTELEERRRHVAPVADQWMNTASGNRRASVADVQDVSGRLVGVALLALRRGPQREDRRRTASG